MSAVSTSGTLNVVITVQVGSQLSGQIKELLADYNSEVRAGQVIARIDPVTFETKVRQAQADLDVARANIHIQQAGIERAQKELANAVAALNTARAQTEKTRVSLVNARRNLDRRRALFQTGAVSFPVPGIYAISVLKDNGSLSLKAACTGITIQACSIGYKGIENLEHYKSGESQALRVLISVTADLSPLEYAEGAYRHGQSKDKQFSKQARLQDPVGGFARRV